ncbi:MAG: hypothetical protein PHW86_07510 [Candidatus Bipolaricaulis sp.]|nr:hypothetical protein [Candidatus Bipolaricaulis sp.]
MSRTLGVALIVVNLAFVVATACSGVVLVGDGAVVVGINEDNDKIDASMWATAATETRHGAVYFGFYFPHLGNRHSTWYEMQGINDQGLFFDLFSTPCRDEEAASPGPMFGPARPPEAIERNLLASCSTVSEALAFLHKKNYAQVLPCVQTLLVDRAGNAAVYTGKTDVFRTGPGFVVTNFWLDDPSLGDWPHDRYFAATSMIAWDGSPTPNRTAQILRAVRHIPTPGDSYADGGTRYSVVCDLAGAVADVYLDGDFTQRARLDLAPLWADGLERVPLAGLSFAPSELP